MRAAVIAVLFTLIISSQAYAEQTWNFNYGTEGWTGGNKLKISASNGVLTGELTGETSETSFITSPNLYFEAKDNDTLEIRIKGQPGLARIFWIGTFDRSFIPQKMVEFPLAKNPGFHTYYLNVRSQNSLWEGSISKIIISPSSSPEGFEIDYIKLSKGNFITDFLSGTQEFMKPMGRTVIGSTINNIPNSSFLGKPVTYYVYVFLLIGFTAFLIKELLKPSKEPFGKKWQNAGRLTITTLFFFWILLEINSIYNQLNILKEDSSLWGKSLEEKRAIVTGPDFYEFLKFCSEKLPPRSKYQFLISSPYHTSKAEYYLYPNIPSASAPEYLLIFREKPMIDSSSFTLLAKYKEGEYILKCN